MKDNVGDFYILNGSIMTVDGMQEVDAEKYKIVYEVIRIIDNVPLYLEDHYQRLLNSLKMLGLPLNLSMSELKIEITKLVHENKLQNCNAKLIMYHQDGKQNYMIYISKSYYPSLEEVEAGIHTSLFQWVRNDPNAKVLNAKYKEEVSRRMADNNAFELLLVNEEGKITEGSKSNSFFIKGSKAYTAPGNLVLKGITRQYILEACRRVGVQVVEALIAVDDLKNIDGLFISGTSIKVLPVASVDSMKFNSSYNPTIVAIRDEFDRMIKDYISSH